MEQKQIYHKQNQGEPSAVSNASAEQVYSQRERVVWMLKKMPSLMLGLALYAIGILLTLHSNLGMSPWDVFHMGIVKHSIFTLGQVSIGTGLAVLLLSYFIGVIPGLASVLNMIFIGLFIDLFDSLNLISTPQTLWGKGLMLVLGILVIGWASYFYLRVNLGSGPRDSLMEGLVKKMDQPVWLIRGLMEGSVLLMGFLMGGPVGIGTLVIAATLGFSVQWAFKLGRYSSKDSEHMSLRQLYRWLKPATPALCAAEQSNTADKC